MTPSALSHVRGDTVTPLLDDPIGVVLDRAVERWPDREALVVKSQGVRYTYSEFARRVDELRTA